MNILITGATGFIGTELVKKFDKKTVTILSRKPSNEFKSINYSLQDFISKECINKKYDVAVHLAGLAHGDFSEADLAKINIESTVALATQLSKYGMQRFIFISSIGVNGNITDGTPFTEKCIVSPNTKYAQSKYQTELVLKKLSQKLGFELVIIRPPLVYGHHAPGNFGQLHRIGSKPIPLPFGLIKNAKSFISLSNLCDFIKMVTKHPDASGELFLISDDEKLSTRDLVLKIRQAKGISSGLIPIPPFIIRMLLIILGRKSMAVQLLDDLEIDNSKAKKLIGWTPRETFLEVFKND